MPKISVIVPVYNTENYLHRCIDSILAQTFTDFELLLINDGSKDHSGKICDDYAEKDNRVRVFHKPNGGVSSARNMGLDNAQGEWISFVDSDDIVTNNALDIIGKDIDAELIVTSHIVNSDGKLSEFGISDDKKKVCDSDRYTFIREYINTNVIKTPWAKYFKRRIIADQRFDEAIACGEDFLFVLEYLHKTRYIYLYDNPSYIWSSPECHFHLKYQSSIGKSIYTLDRIYNTYKTLNLNLPEFECCLFYDYKSLCQQEIYKTPRIWYNDVTIRKIYNEIKQHFGYLFRVKYRLMSNVLISKILQRIRE